MHVLQISFRNMTASPALEEKIRSRAEKLERFHAGITGCRVIVEAPHRHHHRGKVYQVCIDLAVPGSEIVVNRPAEQNHAHEDVLVAVRDAFDAAERRVEDFVQRRQGRVKARAEGAATAA
jgi:ribosome-associated translation inhibitor RaiA